MADKEIKNTELSYYKEAFKMANIAFGMNEVPVGAIIVDSNGDIVGRGFNKTISNSSITGHAELNAINEASKNKGDFRLTDCTIYITMEPCLMCYGAIINSRIKKIRYSVDNEKYGFSKFVELKDININKGIMEKEVKKILSDFFKERR